ncbi:MAG TPA: hypothetical protein VIM34_02520 [Burkholderiaceae bacterium]
MIWSKTDAGRIEMQARALVKERAQRNLLLVIDGVKTEEMLLAGLAGITAADFAALQSLGLIAPLAPASAARPSATQPGRTEIAPPVVAPPQDYAQFTAALTQLISKELGLRGFVLTLAVEKAATIEDLQAVAQRTLAQIADRKGEAAAASARRTLYGG